MTDSTMPDGGSAPDPSSSELAKGSTFGKYRIVRIAGQGGKGIVYEALDSVLDRKVALKIIRPEALADAKDLDLESQRFLTEARLLANLPKHDHIVGVYEAGDLDGKRFLSMEFVEGRPMTGWRKKAGVKPQVRAIHDIALAMEHAHKHGIIHRDLKPQNILIDAEGRPHVTDFGLAKKTGNEQDLNRTESGTVWGTPTYMSPEQARNEKGLDHRSDIYSMGVMLFEALTGRPPFQGTSPQETMQQIVRQPTPKTGRFVKTEDQTPLHTALEPVVMKALEKHAANRFSSAKEFADQIAKAVNPLSTRRSAAPAEIRIVQAAAPPPPQGGSKGLLYGVGAAAAAAVLVLAFLLLSGGDPGQAHVAEGDGHMAARQYARALDAYQRALTVNPESARAQSGRDRAQQALDEIRRRQEAASRKEETEKTEEERRKDTEVERLRLQLEAAKKEATLAKVDQIKARERADAEAKRARDAQLLAQRLKNETKEPTTPQPAPPTTPKPATPPAPKPPAAPPAAKPAAPAPPAAPNPNPSPAPAAPRPNLPPDAPEVAPTGEPTVMEDGSLHWEAENFSGGDHPVAGKDFHDSTEGNAGKRYRNGDADIGGRSDSGYRVYATDPGEWLHYVFTGGGRFEVEVAYTFARADEEVHIEVDGKDVTGRIRLERQRDNELTIARSGFFDLEDGLHDVRFCFDSGQIYFEWFRFRRITLLAVPDAAAQKKAEDVIRDLFKAEYAKRSTIDLQLLAQSLLEQGKRTTDDPAARYVFFREAKEVSVKAGDAATAFIAVDELAREFKVDPLPMKLDVLDDARRTARTVEAAKGLVEAYLKMVEVMITAEEIETAASLISKAESPARATKDPALITSVRERGKELSAVAREFRPVKSALEKLKSDPDDARAHLTVGSYRCFTRDNWDRGLPHLAKGSDAQLAELAKKELAGPADARAKAALAEAWMEAAKRKSSETKMKYHSRSLFWYEAALAEATSLLKIKIEGEMGELYKAIASSGMLRRGLAFWMEPGKDPRMPFRDHAGQSRLTNYGKPAYDPATRSLVSSQGAVEYTPSSTIQSVGTQGAIVAWIRADQFNQNAGIIYRAGARSTDFGLWVYGERLAIWLNYPANQRAYISNGRMQDGKWHHCVVTWNDKEIRFYINGDLDRTVAHGGAPSGKGMRVGVGNNAQRRDRYFVGNIGLILVYNRLLSETEARQLYAGGRTRFR